MAELNVKGLKELQKFMDTLSPKLEANVMRSALRAGANVIKAAAKQNVPVKSGTLRDSIRVTTRSRGGKVSASVNVGGKKAWYAHIIEFTGAAAHKITAKKGSALAFAGGLYESVDHPGMKAKAFFRPALDAQAQNAIVEVGKHIKSRLATKHGIDTAGIAIK